MPDQRQALRDVTTAATIYLMAVDAPELLTDTTAEQARLDLLHAVKRAEAALDTADAKPTASQPPHTRRTRRPG